MRCLTPRTVGFKADGKTISWSPKQYSKEFALFKLPCGKCLECRLDYARQWAVRCVHEAKMYSENSFITLTYSDEFLGDGKLRYRDFQLFMKRVRDDRFRKFLANFGEENWKLLSKNERKEIYGREKIGFFVTGEYGDRTKRPHWHAILFNWSPGDLLYKYSNDRGDRVYDSSSLTDLWGKGIAEVGSVTFESAGYCARYAAKKLVHGFDGEHDYEPISKKSNKQAIGRAFLERYWKDIFNYGEVILDSGAKCSIPRYYEKWLKDNHFEEYCSYVERVKSKKCEQAEINSKKEEARERAVNESRGLGRGCQIKKSRVRKILIEEKYKMLNAARRGD